MAEEPASTLEILPNEMLVEVLKQLDYSSIQKMREMNRRLYDVISIRRHLFERFDIELSVSLHQNKTDVLRISIRHSIKKDGDSSFSAGSRTREMDTWTPVERSAEFRIVQDAAENFDGYPIASWTQLKKVGQSEEPFAVRSCENVLEHYLPQLLSYCNPAELNVYQCTNTTLTKLGEALKAFKCKVDRLDLNCGTASPKSVAKFLNCIEPDRVVYRAETRDYVTIETCKSRAFRSANDLDVVVFQLPRNGRNPLPTECFQWLTGQFFYTNISVEVTNTMISDLVKGFMKFNRHFDNNLGWSMPCKTTSLDPRKAFRNMIYTVRTMLNDLREPCGQFFELCRGPREEDKLRIMWNRGTLLVNGILSSLRHHHEFI